MFVINWCLFGSPYFSPTAASVLLLRVRVVCLRGVFALRTSSAMKRGKNAEEATSDGENNTASGS